MQKNNEMQRFDLQEVSYYVLLQGISYAPETTFVIPRYLSANENTKTWPMTRTLVQYEPIKPPYTIAPILHYNETKYKK